MSINKDMANRIHSAVGLINSGWKKVTESAIETIEHCLTHDHNAEPIRYMAQHIADSHGVDTDLF